MSSDSIRTIWETCIPRPDVLKGKFLASELALSLSNIVSGNANPPYDNPETFFESTFPTRNIKIIVSEVLKRLSGNGDNVNPVIILDVGFGGGKTHTLASLYYGVKYGAPQLTTLLAPSNTKIIAISGDEYDSKGIKRDKLNIRTIWGDLFYQLGQYEQFKNMDLPTEFPGKQKIMEAMGEDPVLVLLDEIPTYLSAIGGNQEFLNNTVHFLQRLILTISSKSNAALVVAIAEDAYKLDADKAKLAIRAAIEDAKKDLGAIYKRQQIEMRPVEDDDVVHVLQKRLFDSIDQQASKKTANAYHEIYSQLPVPEEYKKKSFRDEMEKCYPFHPELIKVFYERIATLEGFHRTRGSLRLLASAITDIWNKKEQDSTLIHPFHIDLADETIANGLTIKIGEPKYRNAIESDVWNSNRSAVAQKLDDQSIAHWRAPLVRRACNTVYLYSLSAGKAGDKGIRQEMLSTLLTTPLRKDHYLRIRDTIVPLLLEDFHFVERHGDRLLFVKEPSLIKLIQNHADDMPMDEVMRVIRDTTASLFSGNPDWMMVSKVFVNSISDLLDETSINVGILNPRWYSLHSQNSIRIPEEISKFMKFRDDMCKKARANINSTFLLVSEESQKQGLFSSAQKLLASREVEYEPEKFGISLDRKSDIARYRSEQESNLHDAIRATFTNIVYVDRDGPKFKNFNPSGYSKAQEGKQVIVNTLNNLYRILDKPFDPEYIILKAWTSGVKSILASDLYDKFHRVPELGIPVTMDIYIETLRKGVESKLWILKTENKITKYDNLKSNVIITDKTEIVLYEEAQNRGLLDDELSTVQGKERILSINDQPTPIDSSVDMFDGSNVTNIEFIDDDLMIIAQSLSQRMKPNYTKVKRLQITTRDSQNHILKANLLFMKLSSDRNCKARLDALVERYTPPEYNLSFRMTKGDLVTDVGKKILELSRQFLEPDHSRLELDLEWENAIPAEMVDKLLREYDGGDRVIATVNATISK